MPLLFNLLFFFVPLVLYPFSYELFEFNKMVFVYALTALISASWVIRMILAKRIIFRHTFLDIPLLLFLFSQLLSTAFSIDVRTSLLGYYSRFHGGFFSTLSYSLLFWAFVSNMDRAKTLKAIRFLLFSGIIVSVYGVLQHFGIDKDVWVQDVQNRVFSTLGQPNWLAAWLLALLPIAWAFYLSSRQKSKNFWQWLGFSALYILTLSYTKSRSGLLGLVTVSGIFWGINFFIYIVKEKSKSFIKNSFLLLTLSLFLIFAGGTPWTPSLEQFLTKGIEGKTPETTGPALETGGTESGQIRKIVWKGAIDVWKNYPLTGSGVETFAFSYYQFRPVEHNLVSEWDFLYNKAHNELLNILATTGILGLGAYLYFSGVVVFYFVKKIKSSPDILDSSFLAGFCGIFVTNFFGFSVVAVSLLYFLLPAFAVCLEGGEKVRLASYKSLDFRQKAGVFLALFIASYLLLGIGRYWYADLLFAKGKTLNDSEDPVKARGELTHAIELSKKEAIFWDELSQSDTLIAIALNEAGEGAKAREFADVAINESSNATILSPRNLNLKRNRANLFIKLSALDPNYLADARDILIDAITYAPTEAKLYYNLGLTYARLGDLENAEKVFEKTISLKANYRDARLAYALILIDKGSREKAKEHLNYILESIDPNDALSRQTLEEIK
jgi:O-antigen ligase